MTERYTGTITEVGGAELGKSGNEKPRKIVASEDPTADKPRTKTFRVWSNDDYFEVCQNNLGKIVTIEYVPEEVTFGDKSWTQNNIIGVLENGDGGGRGEPQPSVGEVGSNAGDSATPSSADWSVPDTAPKTANGGATDWDERGLQMEAAWAVKAVLDRTPNDVDISHSQLVERAVKLAILKRQVASELGS